GGDASTSSAGTFSFELTGVYTFTLHAHAPGSGGIGIGGGGDMTYDETGSATFVWDVSGTVDNGAYAVGTESLAQTVTGTYSYYYPGGSQSGSADHSSSAFMGDPKHWYAYNWYGLVPASFGSGVPHPYDFS